jgi:hypothetical protein
VSTLSVVLSQVDGVDAISGAVATDTERLFLPKVRNLPKRKRRLRRTMLHSCSQLHRLPMKIYPRFLSGLPLSSTPRSRRLGN